MEWRDIEGYPGYEISDEGLVRSSLVSHRAKNIDRSSGKHILTPKACSNGYKHVILCKDGTRKHALIHRLVAKAFLDRPSDPKMDVAHNDGTRDNNRVDNLRWATRSENHLDKRRHGTSMIGERNPISKLTGDQVLYIRANASAKKAGSYDFMSSMFGVSKVTIGNIVNRKVWTHI